VGGGQVRTADKLSRVWTRQKSAAPVKPERGGMIRQRYRCSIRRRVAAA